MSRIGKKPIILPENVMANITGQKIEVKGPNGSRDQKKWKLILVIIKLL